MSMKNVKRTVRLLGAWTAICVVLSAQVVQAGEVVDELKAAVDRIVVILNDPYLCAPENRDRRDRELCALVEERFDWEALSKRSLIHYWHTLTPAQQEEFTALFTDYLETMYVCNIDVFLRELKQFSGKNITFINETICGRLARVDAEIDTGSGKIMVGYKLARKPHGWMAYDITVNGLWLADNFHAQFRDILSRESFDFLLDKLREKLADLKSRTETATQFNPDPAFALPQGVDF